MTLTRSCSPLGWEPNLLIPRVGPFFQALSPLPSQPWACLSEPPLSHPLCPTPGSIPYLWRAAESLRGGSKMVLGVNWRETATVWSGGGGTGNLDCTAFPTLLLASLLVPRVHLPSRIMSCPVSVPFTCAPHLLDRSFSPHPILWARQRTTVSSENGSRLLVESEEENWWDPLSTLPDPLLIRPWISAANTTPSRARNRHTLALPHLPPSHTLLPSSCLLLRLPLPSFLRLELQPAASTQAGGRSAARELPGSARPAGLTSGQAEGRDRAWKHLCAPAEPPGFHSSFD